MDCLPVKIYFVNSCEVTTFTVNELVRSPYATLQRILVARGVESFSAAWSDEYNNFFPLKSDQSFADAVEARQHRHQPLRIFVKETSPQQHGRNFRPRGFSGSFPGGRSGAPRDDRQSPMGPWSGHKVIGPKERMSELDGRKMYHDGAHRHQDQNRHSFQPQGRQDMRDVPRMPSPAASGNNPRSQLMPKDPTLAELVDNVRYSLNMVASMHSSQTDERNDDIVEQSAVVLIETAELACSGTTKVTTVYVSDDVVANADESIMIKNCLSDLLEEFAAEEEAFHLRDVPGRAESVMSDGDDFMVITPATDSSCVYFCMEDFEAALSDLDSEDTFEIVDCPDGDWDSDIE